jgi:hypothetical protein
MAVFIRFLCIFLIGFHCHWRLSLSDPYLWSLTFLCFCINPNHLFFVLSLSFYFSFYIFCKWFSCRDSIWQLLSVYLFWCPSVKLSFCLSVQPRVCLVCLFFEMSNLNSERCNSVLLSDLSFDSLNVRVQLSDALFHLVDRALQSILKIWSYVFQSAKCVKSIIAEM